MDNDKLIDFIISREIDCFYEIDNHIYSKIINFNNESKIIEVPEEYFELLEEIMPLLNNDNEYKLLLYFQYLTEVQINSSNAIKQSIKDMKSLGNIADMVTFNTTLGKGLTPTPFSIGWSLIDKFSEMLNKNYKLSRDIVEKKNIEKCMRLFSGIKKRLKEDKYISKRTVDILHKATQSFKNMQAKKIVNRDQFNSITGKILNKAANSLNFLSKFDSSSTLLPTSYLIRGALGLDRKIKTSNLSKNKEFNKVQDSSWRMKQANKLLAQAKDKIKLQNKK